MKSEGGRVWGGNPTGTFSPGLGSSLRSDERMKHLSWDFAGDARRHVFSHPLSASIFCRFQDDD